jgi:hypothetical protein
VEDPYPPQGPDTTEEIGSVKGLHIRLAIRTTSRVGPLSRKTVALAITLVLCLVAFVLAAGDTWAAEKPSQEKPSQEKPSQAAQHGTVEGTTTINGKVAEPVAEKTPPVETPPVEAPPTQTPPTQTPLPPTSETPPANEPSPPPVEPAPSMPEPEPTPQPTPQPAPQPAPQWFAVVIADGETVDSEPVLTYWPTTDPEQAPNVAYPVPGSEAPVEDSGSYVPSTSADAWPPVYAVEEDAAPTDQWASEPFLGPVAADPLAPDPVAPERAALFGMRGEAPIASPKPSAATKPVSLTPAPDFPASVGGAPRLPSSLGTTAASAVGTVKNAAASVASATAEALWYLASGSPGTSTTDSTDGTQGHPSEDTPQPAPAPLVPLGGSGLFSLSTSGGHAGAGGSFAPPLVGILALLGVILLRRDFRRYLASCEMPKPSSALLSPLERPG